MPWSKAYDEEVVIERAMLAFWRRGYHATSMAELVAETGINRGSIYAAFGDKRGLFLRALAQYARTELAAPLVQDAQAQDPVRAILGPLERAAQPVPDRPGGCLVVLTAQELGPHDPEIATIIADHFATLEEHFRKQLKAARTTGQIPQTVRPRATSKALVGLWAGLHVLSRSGADPAATAVALKGAHALLT